MVGGSGGTAAAFGFHYQYLATVEVLLELYEHASASGWRVGVDLHGQDSADILVFPRLSGPPSRAVQVKASMASSATKMDWPTAVRCLNALDAEHPGAAELVLLTNRTLSAPAMEYAALLREQRATGSCRRSIDVRHEDVRDVVSRLVDRIAQIRPRGKGGLGQRLHHILLAQLIDLVLARGSQIGAQFIDHNQVADILDESAAVLADAGGARSWGRAHGMPTGRYVPRPAIADFLATHLPEDALYSGAPAVAVLSGLSGSGKSAAVASWAAARREHYSVSLWVDASSDQALAEQTPTLLEWLGTGGALGDDPAQFLRDALAELPVPWLLVLDGAREHAEMTSWIPASGYGHVVVTTNRGDWPIDIAPQREVEGIADADAIALIRDRLPTPQGAEGNDETALRFAARLGRWPLAIDLACAWVRGLGGDYTRLSEFLARLDRLDLLAGTVQLGGYPRNVSGVISELWAGLSPQSRAVLTIVIISGGAHVPISVIDRWATSSRAAGALEIDPRIALNELVGAALMTQRLRCDAGNISGIDEAVYVHEGIQAVLSGAIGAEIELVFHWVEAYASTVNELVDSARIVEASALLPAAEGLLRSLLTAGVADGDDELPLQMVQATATTMMHNIGTLATLTGLLDTASTWLWLAVETRETLVSDQQRTTPAFAATQIETLAGLVQVVVRQSRFDEIQTIVEEALRQLNSTPVEELERAGVPVAQSLWALGEATQYASGDSTHLRARIESALQGHALHMPVQSALQRQVSHFYAVNEQARAHADTEQWSRAVDTVLTAANKAVSAGMLEHDAVEAVLDTSLKLMHSRLVRSHVEPAPSWTAAIGRLVEWGEGNIDSFDQYQQMRFSILVPFADQDLPQLRAVLHEIRCAGTGTPQVGAWVDLGEIALEAISGQQFGVLLGGEGMPQDMRLIRAVDGGDEVLWWTVMVHDEPLLAFVTVSASMYVNGEVLDPLREALIAAGFPGELGEDGQPQLAAGWRVCVEQDTIVLQDPQGRPWLDAIAATDDPHIREWWAAVDQTEVLRVVYRDAADLTAREILSTEAQALAKVSRPRPPRS